MVDRDRRPLLGAHVLRHRDARRLPVVGRPAPRAAPRAVARPARPASPATSTPRSSSTCCATSRPTAAPRARRPRRLLRPVQPRRRPALPAQRHRDAGVDGHLGGVQPPRGRPRPAGDRPALRRRADDGRQHHDLPVRREGGRDHPGRAGVVHAQAVHRPPGLGDAHPLLAVRGRPQRLPRPGRPLRALRDRQGVRRGRAAARPGDHRGHQPVGELLQAADRRRRGPDGGVLGAREPLRAGPGADVLAGQVVDAPGGDPHAGQRLQPLPRLRRDPRRRADRASRRATSWPRRPRTTSGR